MSDLVSVYSIKNVKTDERYIGVSVRPKHRKGRHFGQLKRGVHPNDKFQTAFNLHGLDAFVYEILEDGITKSIAGQREYHWINYYNSIERGYNKSDSVFRYFRGDIEMKEGSDPREWVKINIPQSVRKQLRTMAINQGFVPDYCTESQSFLDIGISNLLEVMINAWAKAEMEE